MNPETIFIIAAAFFFAASIKGVTGLGFSTFALPVLVLTIGIKATLPILIIPSLFSNILVMVQVGRFRETLRRFWLLYLCTIPGVYLGLMLLQSIDSKTAGAVLGSVLLLYSLFAMSMPNLSLSVCQERRLAPVVGITTGAINGLTGSQMMPLLPYLLTLNMDSSRFIQAINISFCLSSMMMAAGLSTIGLMNIDTLLISILGVLPVFLGIRFGSCIRKGLSQKVFRQVVLILLLILSLTLITQIFW